MLGLLEYWCPETNTFVFPWGDIVNLAGPSVLGELVTEPLAADSVNIEEEMSQHRKEMCQSKSKKARHGSVLDNWHHSSYYREEDEQGVLDGSSSDGELHSFVICLHASELVGLDCKDSYLPHRVAMQFGMDQDLPGEPYRSDFTFKNIRFFVPSRTFVAGVSVRCLISCWKECMQAPFFCTESEELQEANTACVQKSFVFFLKHGILEKTVLRTDQVESRQS